MSGEIPSFTGANARQLKSKFNMKIKTSVTHANKSVIQEKLQSHVETLQVQGSLLCLASQEKEDLLWKSTMFQLKSGTLKFMLNACIDTLPTPANLKRLKKSSSDRCKLCGNKGTSNHYLNCCITMLNTGRYTWRHNNLVNFIVNNVAKNFQFFSDLPGGATIPVNLCVTNMKPDIVIIDPQKKQLHIFELTCPMTANIEKRNLEKEEEKNMHHL